MKFKVGDKARVVSYEDHNVPVGSIVKIVEVDDECDPIPYSAKYKGGEFWFRPSELEPATEVPARQFTPGDRVRVLRDINDDLTPGTLGTVVRRHPSRPATECYIEIEDGCGAEYLMLDSELALVTDEAPTTTPTTTYREAALAALMAQLKSEDPDVVRKAAELLLAVGE